VLPVEEEVIRGGGPLGDETWEWEWEWERMSEWIHHRWEQTYGHQILGTKERPRREREGVSSLDSNVGSLTTFGGKNKERKKNLTWC
jgi:hypothetical protein